MDSIKSMENSRSIAQKLAKQSRSPEKAKQDAINARKGRQAYIDACKQQYEEDINDYMAREVLPHLPDAKAFWEENLGAKNPVIKIGAEIPFTRYFYKYKEPENSENLKEKIAIIEELISKKMKNIFA